MTFSPDYRHEIHQKPFRKRALVIGQNEGEPSPLSDVRLTVANICTAFDERVIGSKFTSGAAAHAVVDLIDGFEFPENGQAFIPAQDLITKGLVRSGDAPIPSTPNPEDWCLLLYRAKVDKFLHSRFAEKEEVTSCNLVVYTKEAYLADPDVCGDEEAGIPRDKEEYVRIKPMDCTHVLVALLASSAPAASTVSPFRFVANLAGGNIDYKAMSLDDLVQLAGKVRDNAHSGWATVADPF